MGFGFRVQNAGVGTISWRTIFLSMMTKWPYSGNPSIPAGDHGTYKTVSIYDRYSAHIRQSRPESGLDLSHFRCESLYNLLRCALPHQPSRGGANGLFQLPSYVPQAPGFWRAPVQIKDLENAICSSPAFLRGCQVSR